MEANIINKYADDEDRRKDMKHKLSIIKHQFRSKWRIAQKKVITFQRQNEQWLKSMTAIPSIIQGTSPGRPELPFEESSERSKRRKTLELRSAGLNKLAYATQMAFRSSGNTAASKVLKDMTKSPKRGEKYKKSYIKTTTDSQIRKPSPKEALSMFVEAGLTREQYNIIRNTNKSLYPCYSLLQKAKNEAYPPKEAYRVTATYSEINLQHLLDLTVKRLLQDIKDIIDKLTSEEKKSLEIIIKWGCDGSTQPSYKMLFESETDNDSYIFQSSFVPLRLVCNKGKKILWQNPVPSSPRYCRPMRIRTIHETADITKEEIQYFENKIKELIPTIHEETSTKHTMLFTMVDAKVCNAATHTTSTMRCYICGATSKEFNNLAKKNKVKEGTLKFGLSVLHARIRFFESLLHVSYKIPIKKWQKRTPSDKLIVEERKKEIQTRFRQELGLIVDVPKANFGNSNDGNTSRRFFENYKESANITGLDENLIYRFKIILEVISSGPKVHTQKFEKYLKDTEKLYVELYGWHPMSPTIHKVLRHGSEVIAEALLPIGQLSEEAAEARNKHIRDYRSNYARKCSREATNMDVLNRLLLTSDPILTGMRKTPKKKSKSFSAEALAMLLPADIVHGGDSSESETVDDYEM